MNRRHFVLALGAIGAVGWSAPSRAAEAWVSPRPDAVKRSLAEWKARLTPQQYYVLFEQGTERAFSGALWDHHADGVYHCAACDLALFDSRTKFDSGTGWPSFWQPVAKDAVALLEDNGWIYTRTEVRCNRCGGHQGHVFDDGPKPTGKRYCINSVALAFRPRAVN
jgi:peptide-methionine (R)-S-oxide reductase